MAEDDLIIDQPGRAPGEGSRQLSEDPKNCAGYLRCEEDRIAFEKRLEAKRRASDEAYARVKAGWRK